MSSIAEDINQFWNEFNAKLIEIKSNIEIALTSSKLTEIKMELNKLQSFATHGARILPLYDVKRTQEEIDKILKFYRIKDSEVNPRKKFKFSQRPVSSTVDRTFRDTKTSTPIISDSSSSSSLCAAQHSAYVIYNLTSTMSHFTSENFVHLNTSTFQLQITQCTRCTITAATQLGSARLESLTDCCILLGPCHSAVYVEKCTNCKIYVICHQLRIHTTHNCEFYVLVNSHPIIEDCTQLIFGPNRSTYGDIASHLKVIYYPYNLHDIDFNSYHKHIK